MIKVILLLIYLWDGELKMERKVYPNPEACATAGAARAKELLADPKFDEGLFAACIPSKTTEA